MIRLIIGANQLRDSERRKHFFSFVFGFLATYFVIFFFQYISFGTSAIIFLSFVLIGERFIAKHSFLRIFNDFLDFMSIYWSRAAILFAFPFLMFFVFLLLGEYDEFKESYISLAEVIGIEFIIIFSFFVITFPIINYWLKPYLENYFLAIEKNPQVLTNKLKYVILNKRFKTLMKLIEKEVDVNTIYAGGQTPLLLAVKEKDLYAVEALLNAGANINHQDDKGVSALMKALKKENIPIVKLLLKNNADVNLADKKGKKALDYAMETKNFELLEMFKYEAIIIKDL